jgi:hypothetical protein
MLDRNALTKWAEAFFDGSSSFSTKPVHLWIDFFRSPLISFSFFTKSVFGSVDLRY